MKESRYFKSKEVDELEIRYKKFIAKLGIKSKLDALSPNDPDYWNKYTTILQSIPFDAKK